MRHLVLCVMSFSVALSVANIGLASVMVDFEGYASAGNSVLLPPDYTEGIPGELYTFKAIPGASASVYDAALTAPNFSSSILGFAGDASIELTGTVPFDLISLFSGSADLTPVNLKVKGFVGVADTYNDSFSGLVGETQQSFTGWKNLTRVVFSSDTGAGFTVGLDQISLAPTAVPEPATASLLGLGTMIGAFCKYRRRKQSV